MTNKKKYVIIYIENEKRKENKNMAARGTESKSTITQKILDTFEGSFVYDKEIRIPMMENGELVQIKCVLTCAKVNVESGGDTAVPVKANVESTPVKQGDFKFDEITPEEAQEVDNLISELGL